MSGYYNTPDRKANGLVTGFEGYGLYFPMSQLQGTASWFGSIFAPQNASVVLRMTGQQDSASFESTHGNGTIISANSAGTIETLAQVIDLVQQEKVCVIGGEYYWNNNGLREDMKGQIDAKEQTCISSR
jgi:hypothetical protein